MQGGYTRDGKIYCVCCKKKTDEFDVSHNGAVIIVNAMRYPICGKCLKNRDEMIIKSIKENRRS